MSELRSMIGLENQNKKAISVAAEVIREYHLTDLQPLLHAIGVNYVDNT